jgi:hypothetical protein
MSKTDTIIFTIVAIIFFVVTFVTEYFYREYAWLRSVESWVPWLQSFNWAPYKRFVRCLYWFGWEILWAFVLLFYCKFNRASSAFLITKASEMVAIITVMKMYWNDPAPYMDRETIDAFECNQDTFQNPSLEVTISAFTYSLMFYLAFDWIDILRPRQQVPEKRDQLNRDGDKVFEDEEDEYFLSPSTSYQKTKENAFMFWAILAILIYVVFLIAYAGMYIGSQSFDQVLFGMTLGYGFFCVVFYYLKDWACEKYIMVSEKIYTTTQSSIFLLINMVFLGLLLLAIRLVYHFQTKDFTVNPKWKSEYKDECGVLTFPSFFDKEMSYAYNFLALSFGVTLGIAVDSILLGGTRVDYNQLRKSEGRNPLLGFIFRVVITVGWGMLNLWGFVSLLQLLVHHSLWPLAIPYFIFGFGLFTFIKYMFKLVGATRPVI